MKSRERASERQACLDLTEAPRKREHHHALPAEKLVARRGGYLGPWVTLEILDNLQLAL